jgi:membrane-associated protease RseP (regulator of RpoE activity)
VRIEKKICTNIISGQSINRVEGFMREAMTNHLDESSQAPQGETGPLNTEFLSLLVRRVMRIDSTTWGTPEQKFLVRFQGELCIDSEKAYDQLAESLRPQNVTPLFRIEDGRHTIHLLEGVIDPKPSNPFVNLVLFILTVFSVLLAGALYDYTGPVSNDFSVIAKYLLLNLWRGWPFAVSLLAILLAHEFGHYLAARYHRSAVSLPYFIPFPISLFGTMGAFIQLKSPPRNRNVLLDIGAAGPYAGLIVAVPVLIYGLVTSDLNNLPDVFQGGQIFEGNSIFYLAIKYAIFGDLLPKPESFYGLSTVSYWLKYFFTGTPLPTGGIDVTLNQVAWAGWAGLLVTALNLIPAGQLDGGHLLYVLFGRNSKKILPIILGVLVLLGFVWSGWWLWAFLVMFLGRVHAEPLDQITPIDQRRKTIALIGLVLFFLLFMPVPLITIL